MDRTLLPLRRPGVAGLCLGLAMLGALAAPARADDVGVTIQTTLSTAYKNTAALTPAITSQLNGGAANSDDPRVIGETLKKLRDGDVLVLAIHSNPSVFALGKTTKPWSEFWKTFGIARPPRLSVAILGGCMADHIEKDDSFKPIAPEKVGELRQIFNAETIYTPKGVIPYVLALNNTNGILTSLMSNKKLSEIDLGGKWYQSISPRWVTPIRWQKATLKELRGTDAASGAYEAGLDVAAGRRKMADTYPLYKDDPVLALEFKSGFARGREEDQQGRAAEYDRLRRQIEGR